MFAQSPVRQDVSERLGVFGLDKRAAAADEASSGNAGADDIVTTGWLVQGCGAHSVIVQAWVNEILTLPEKTTDTTRQSRSTMNGTNSQLHKGGSTNKTSDQRPLVLLNSGYQLLNYIINERLKRIVEQTNVLEPGQGGGRQGRSVNINMQKMHFVTHEAHRQGKRVYRVDIDFRNAFMMMIALIITLGEII